MIFSFRQFDIRHRDSLLKVNTDAVLLGALLQSKNEIKTILDIGTGCGVIALMSAQKFLDAIIDAIDIDKPSIEEAAFNFEKSKFAERLNAHYISLQDYSDSKTRYDLIVSNPPYFEVPQFSKGNNPQDIAEGRKKFATHYSLNFDELVKITSGLLKEEGSFWVILPFNAREEFINIALKNKLHLQKEILIQSKPNTDYIRMVLCFGFENPQLESSTLTIYNADGTRHAEYIEITKDYYL